LFQRPGYNDLNILNKEYVAGRLMKFDAVMTKTPPATIAKGATPSPAKAAEEPKEEIKDVKGAEAVKPVTPVSTILPSKTKASPAKPPTV
jgi:hypothetical protein